MNLIMDEHHKELLDHIKNAISETVLEKKLGLHFLEVLIAH